MEVDMVILSLIVCAIVALFLTLLVFFWYSGLFIQPDILTCKPPFKNLEIAYKFAKGRYKDSGALFSEAHSLAPNLRCIGVYYDDCPAILDKMRYIIGLILNDADSPVDDETRKRILAKGFQITNFPEVEFVVYSEFPHVCSFSVLIAVHKLIPAFRDYVRNRQLDAFPLIEICNGKKIIYAAPLSYQGAFFVPEALAESEEEPTSGPRTFDGTEETSGHDIEDLQQDTTSSVDSLEGQSKDLPSMEIIDSLEDNKNEGTNGSEASTESFEELQLDS